MLAPIALFAYRRPQHLARVLAALRANPEAPGTVLYVFCDAPKDTAAAEAVGEVRRLIREIDGFAAVHPVFRESNFGLARNITEGVSDVLGRHEALIVVEDDVVVGPFFLRFMNDALSFYRDEPRVGSVSGYCYPVSRPLPETYFIRGADCWGWATWRDRWRHYNPDGPALLAELQSRGLTTAFDFDGAMAFTQMLQDQIAGKNDSWAVRWHASCFLRDLLILYPAQPLAKNIGFDGSGTHSTSSIDLFEVGLSPTAVQVDGIAVEENAAVREGIKQFFLNSEQPRGCSSGEVFPVNERKSLSRRAVRYGIYRLRRAYEYGNAYARHAILTRRLNQRRRLPGGEWHPLFKVPLVDLGEVEDAHFRGVVTPAPEIGVRREGVDAQFLGDAESYYTKYQNFVYWRALIEQMVARTGLGEPSTIVEFGCGFGNSTLPLLDLFPNAKVVATDISPNLLAILNRLLVSRKLQDRCIAVAMDAHKDFIATNSADLVIGSAILHHLADPSIFIQRAFEILRPGGAAAFFEPFEGGYSVLRLICEDIWREAERRHETGGGLKFVRQISRSLEPQIFRQAVPGWKNINDKWVFPRHTLDKLATSVGAELTVYPVHDNVGQFRRAFAYMLGAYSRFKPEDIPAWAWETFDRYDTKTFSPEMLVDLAMEGCIIFRKRT